MTEYAIEVNDIHKYYGETHALDGVNLRAEKGKVLALLGPNGSGKTTLVRILQPCSMPIRVQQPLQVLMLLTTLRRCVLL